MFTEKDYKQLDSMGISPDSVAAQIKMFESGFPYCTLVAPATPQRGVVVLTGNQINEALDRCAGYSGAICKFVPASGAATRMFKELYELMDAIEKGRGEERNKNGESFFKNLQRFAFYNDLKSRGIDESSNKAAVIKTLLEPDGLNYGQLPKGLIKFHSYKNSQRTPFEEHLIAAAGYAKDAEGVAEVVFTVSPEHLDSFIVLKNKILPELEKLYSCSFKVEFTTQKRSTDTIAVDLNNRPFRTKDSSLLFRPAGHGALIENLNEIDSELIIIRNIDNISKEDYLQNNIKWKKILTGVLIGLRDKIFGYLERIDNSFDSELAEEIIDFFDKELATETPRIPGEILKDYLRAKLNRPVRVCGMVKNSGEPGGGPFIVRDAEGSTSLQILESAQLDLNDKNTADMLKQSTHFNPVDIVCCVKDYKGFKFNLREFSDPETGFITHKSMEGRELKALEMPGLWNGAMSRWNTLFVEVPLSTFTPVKTIFDLLREEHQ